MAWTDLATPLQAGFSPLKSNSDRLRVRVPDEVDAPESSPPNSSRWPLRGAIFPGIVLRVPRIVVRSNARLPPLGSAENQRRSFQSGFGWFSGGRISH